MFWVKFIIFIAIAGLGFLLGSLASSPLLQQNATVLQGFSLPENYQAEITPTVSPLPSQTPSQGKRGVELSDGVYIAVATPEGVTIKNQSTQTEKLILKTRLNIKNIIWENPEFLILEVVSLQDTLQHYKLYLSGKLEML